ncbi:MAG: hypothetical protein FWE77_03040 [Clostridia bacterium]|nr:hypothetical protein [Clostridia bacterium]
MNRFQTTAFQKTVSILLAILLLAASGASAAFATGTAPSAHTPQQAEAAALATEHVLANIEILQASTKSPWIKEMLENASITDTAVGEPNKSGAIPVEITVAYPLLASGVDAKTPFDGNDPEAFVRAALENAMSETGAHVLQATVTFREGKDPTFKWHASKGFSGFRTALTNRAKTSAASFSSKPMVAALSAFVFDHPVRGAKLDVTGGLRAMNLRAVAPPINRMLRIAANNALTRVAYEAQGPNTNMDVLRSLFDEEIAKYGATFAKASKAKTDQNVSLSFDPLALLEERKADVNAQAEAYRTEYTADSSMYMMALLFRTMELPDLPALPKPETERLQGGRNGTKVTVRAKKGDGDLMVRFIRDNDVKALGFIRDGGRVVFYLPSGNYIMQSGSGSIWYGEEELFGPDGIGTYSYDMVRIPSSKYEYILTIGTAEDPNADNVMEGLNREDFL